MPSMKDVVRYGQSGLCRIDRQVEKEIAGKTSLYYELTPLFKVGSTLFVPCDNEELVGKMCPPLTRDEVEALLAEASKTETLWVRDFRKRSEASKRALVSSDRAEALILIKTIYDHRREMRDTGMRIHTTDDYFLKDAEELIYSEFSYVLGVPYEEVEDRVRKLFGVEG